MNATTKIGVDYFKCTALVDAFNAKLKECLTPAEFKAAITENFRRQDDTCATHDYCDANEVMAEAFEATFGREPDLGDTADADLDLMNAAWNAWQKQYNEAFEAARSS